MITLRLDSSNPFYEGTILWQDINALFFTTTMTQMKLTPTMHKNLRKMMQPFECTKHCDENLKIQDFTQSGFQESIFFPLNFYPTGKTERLHLLRYQDFAVVHYSFSPECLGVETFLFFAMLGLTQLMVFIQQFPILRLS
ncbi:MAG: hypothetical protein HUK40_06965 [Desulfobacter sp.]|nr:hypothetical protein [Desulfobacter sp.]